MDKRHQLKIVFSGMVSAGKTTAISCVSEIEVVKTDEKASDSVALKKEITTVALDYGQIVLDKRTRVHLYGTPGQDRFDFMWEILAEGAIGIILLIDASAENAKSELLKYLKIFRQQIKLGSVVIGLSHVDKVNDFDINEYRKIMKDWDYAQPVFTVDARKKSNIKALIKILLYRINPLL